MIKKRVAMVDFWSVCDEKGKPIGHGRKVGNEYYNYIADSFDVVQYANEGMLQHLVNPRRCTFAHSLQNGFPKWKRILTTFQCLREVYRKEAESVIWFYVPDIYLFLFLLLSVKGKRRIVVNVYEDYGNSKIKRWIFRKALKKVDAVFATNKRLLQSIPNGMFIPDYAYREEEYGRYTGLEKKERAVCLGTMNEKKKLLDAVEAFSKNGYPLYIAGQFSSVETYKRLCSIKGNNIVIENRYIDSEEYYQILASSKLCLIPYDEEFYRNRTSGVLQECLFTDTIPISHKSILEFSDIPGIGYADIRELAGMDLKDIDAVKLKNEYKEKRCQFYSYHTVKETVIETIIKSLYGFHE